MVSIFKNSKLNLIKISIFYLMLVAFTQYVELLLPFSVTKFFFLVYVAFMVWYCYDTGVRFKKETFIAIGLLVVYSAIYFLRVRSVISYVYPPLVALVVFSFIKDEKIELDKHTRMTLEIAITVYLVISLLLFLLRFPACFQEDMTRFKGALPHANMFCALLTCVFVALFYRQSVLSYVNRFIIVFLVFLSGSRTYIVINAFCFALMVLRMVFPKVKFFKKFLVLCGVGVVAIVLALTVFKNIPFIQRFIALGLSGNGRQFLEEACLYVIQNCNKLYMSFGVFTTEMYLAYPLIDFSHSFSENTYMGIFLLFGLVGIVCLLLCVIYVFKRAKRPETFLLLAVQLLSFYFQDTLLSVQLSIAVIVSTLLLLRDEKILIVNKKLFKLFYGKKKGARK